MDASAHPHFRQLSFTSDQEEWLKTAIVSGSDHITASELRVRMQNEMELRRQVDKLTDNEVGKRDENVDKEVLVTSQDIRNFKKKQQLIALDGKTERMESEFKLRNDAKRTREISQEGQMELIQNARMKTCY